MCIRDKHSYGCGCSFKEDQICGSSRCSGTQKFHYVHEGDCRNCRHGGDVVTRGREGQGRYAKEISRRDPVDVSGGASPWAPDPASRRQKEWGSPTRREADSAWEKEHEKRIDDLQTRADKLSLASHTPPRAASPEPLDERYDSHDSGSDRQSRHHKKLYAEVAYDDDRSSTRHRRDHRSRRDPTDSYESFESLPPRHRSGPQKSYSYRDDPYDSGYGSHSSYRAPAYNSRRPGMIHSSSAGLYGYGAKTEPREYAYSLPRSRTYDVPISPNYGGYSNPLGAYGVELSPSGRARLIQRQY